MPNEPGNRTPLESAHMQPYLHRLFMEARRQMLRILLQDMNADLEQDESMERIEALLGNEEKFEHFRKALGDHFPGNIARLLKLVDKDDKVYPIDQLRDALRRHIGKIKEGPKDDEDADSLRMLNQSSKLQQQLAYLVNYPPGKWLLEQEIPAVEASRAVRLKEDVKPAPYPRHADPYLWSRDAGRLRGLCLSGGGIRSATFNLGVLQGLAKKKLLHQFDYCSSVSGGGYIHQWLAAWIKREEVRGNRIGRTGLDVVSEQLVPLPDQDDLHFAPEPIKWLRRYSNYLTPQKGVLGADFWVTVAIWMRNTFLNQTILICFLTCVLLIPHVFLMHPVDRHSLAAARGALGSAPAYVFEWVQVLIALLAGIPYMTGVVQVANGLRATRLRSARDGRISNGDFLVRVAIWFLLAAIVISDASFFFEIPGLSPEIQTGAVFGFSFASMFALATALNWAGDVFRRDCTGRVSALRVIGFTAAAVISGFICGACMVGLRLAALHYLPMLATQVDGHYAPFEWGSVLCFGPLAVVFVSFVGIICHSGLLGNSLADADLEWLGRTRAWMTMYSLLWTGWMTVSIFGCDMVDWLWKQHGAVKWSAVGGWMVTTALGVLTGKSGSSSGDPAGDSKTVRIISLIGPPVYVLGLLLLISAGVELELRWATHMMRVSQLPLLAVVLLPFLGFALFGWRVDVNEFSMHSYYRNRLTRCYLGASNTHRNADPLTGFDANDLEDMQVSHFQPSGGYSGPLPIFCATLNISTGEDLAWQERKAASFAFSPVLTGYYVPWTGSSSGELSFNGFVPTAKFCEPGDGVHISTAAAISGAALSPNAGYHTSLPMAFLLTMFNVRLGWWMRNTRRARLAFDPNAPADSPGSSTPSFAPFQLIPELMGSIGDDRKFVYLTDGGHFDDMGLYELVRRRCYNIVICDAEEDEGPVFEGIGMSIRKCRIDFGVEIELDLNAMAIDAASKLSKVHWITGTIRYPETGRAEPGRILYIKSSITGREAADVYNYRLQHTVFPQDSTTDQWFSESQFESYRRLGQQVIDECPFLVNSRA